MRIVVSLNTFSRSESNWFCLESWARSLEDEMYSRDGKNFFSSFPSERSALISLSCIVLVRASTLSRNTTCDAPVVDLAFKSVLLTGTFLGDGNKKFWIDYRLNFHYYRFVLILEKYFVLSHIYGDWNYIIHNWNGYPCYFKTNLFFMDDFLKYTRKVYDSIDFMLNLLRCNNTNWVDITFIWETIFRK